jgi:hypothetical protein
MIEACPQALATEHVEPALMREQRVAGRGAGCGRVRDQRAQRLGVAVAHRPWVVGEGEQARALARARRSRRRWRPRCRRRARAGAASARAEPARRGAPRDGSRRHAAASRTAPPPAGRAAGRHRAPGARARSAHPAAPARAARRAAAAARARRSRPPGRAAGAPRGRGHRRGGGRRGRVSRAHDRDPRCATTSRHRIADHRDARARARSSARQAGPVADRYSRPRHSTREPRRIACSRSPRTFPRRSGTGAPRAARVRRASTWRPRRAAWRRRRASRRGRARDR